MTCKRVLFWGVLLAVLTPAALGAQAEPDCAAWNTSEYFETATPEDVTACLAAGANVSARGTGQRTPLHQAALYNQNPAVIEALLAAGADPAALVYDGNTPLHFAAESNPNPAVFQALLDAGADVEARSTGQWTPLHRAAYFNENPMVIQVLLAAGADPMARDESEKTPLHLATQQNSVAVIEFLLSKGTPPILSAQDCRMWHTNVFFRTATVQDVKVCLDAGADPEARGTGQWTPLHRAAAYTDNPEVIEALVAAGADPMARDESEKTPLHRAAESNPNPAVFQALLDAGADVEARSAGQWTPLHWAANANTNPEVIEALLDAGADPTAETNRAYLTPLHLAAESNPNPAVLEALLRRDADVDAAGRGGVTPLSLAVNDGNVAVIKTLLEAGADPMKHIWGSGAGGGAPSTPLDEANGLVFELLQAAVETAGQDCNLWNTKRYFQAATFESVTDCMEAGADPKARDSWNNTPLHLAVSFNTNPAVLQALLNAGADLEARAEYEYTPLHRAFGGNTNPAVLQALLDAGADLEARNQWGSTPLHWALSSAKKAYNRQNKESHYTTVVQLLIDAGADVQARDETWKETALQRASGFNALYGLSDSILEILLKAVAPVPIEEVGETIAGMEFVWVPAGGFRMGSDSAEADDDERPLTQVRISRGFWLGKYEVTQDQWQGVMGTNLSWFSGCGRQCPVEQVSWNDVQEFIGRLNAQAGGNRYRLPTEAEWEYAARGGDERRPLLRRPRRDRVV